MNEIQAAKLYEELGVFASKKIARGTSMADVGLAMLRSGALLIRTGAGAAILAEAMKEVESEAESQTKRAHLSVVR